MDGLSDDLNIVGGVDAHSSGPGAKFNRAGSGIDLPLANRR